MNNELDNIKLLGKNILIKPDLAIKEGTTDSGIIVRNQGQDSTSKWGEVIKIGTETDEVAVGDKILLWGITVGEIHLDNVEYMMAMSSKLLAIIPKK